MRNFALVLSLLLSGAACAVEWRDLDSAHHLGGRKTSEGYLQGKVVLVCRWNQAETGSREMLLRLENVWQSFKTKPFVVLAGLNEREDPTGAARKFVTNERLSFPVYAGGALGTDEPTFASVPFLYVVDGTGKVVYHGTDDRLATQALVMALTDLESPRNLTQWRRFLDFELTTLPGRAYLRADEFRKKYPEEAKAYLARFKKLVAIPEVRKLAELVAFARKAKDAQSFDDRAAAKKQQFVKSVKGAISKYASLAEAEDPRVAQEAKNALADLKWTLAAL